MKIIAVILLMLLVTTQTPVGQLAKLPSLIEHYIKHKKNTGASLISFLIMHYTTHHKDADYPEDQNLPFKNIVYPSIGYAVLPTLIKANLYHITITIQKIILSDHYLPQQKLDSIFHPPRI